MIPEDKERCSVCEGWGVTSYESDGSPNACPRCQGSGLTDKPLPKVETPETSYADTLRDELVKLAKELEGSRLSDVSALAKLALDFIEEIDEFGWEGKYQ